MKRTILRGSAAVLIMICCAAGGYLAGAHGSTATAGKGTFLSGSQNEEYDVQMMAIVNLDEGVTGGGETISYSQALLSTLDIPYEVTNLEAARQGMQDGRYSSYLILPGTFSASVETINTSPQKAVLEYAVSTQLTDEAKETAIYDIGNAYTKLNNGLSEMYLSSVVDEIHSVQDSVETIMGNDEKDLEALESVRGDDLTESIQLPELETVENNIQVLDLTADYQENDNILDSINTSYESAVSNGIVDYDKIREQLAAAEASQSTAGTEKEELAGVVNGLATDIYDDSFLAASEDSVYDTYGGELLSRINDVETAVKTMNENIPGIRDYGDKLKQDEAWYKEALGKFETLKTDETTQKMTVDSEEQYDITVRTYKYYIPSEVDTLINAADDVKKKYANEKLEEYYTDVQKKNSDAIKALDAWYQENITDPDITKPDWASMIGSDEPTYEAVSDPNVSTAVPQAEMVTTYKVSESAYPETDPSAELVTLPSLNVPTEPSQSDGEKVEGTAEELLTTIIDTAMNGRTQRTNQISSQQQSTQRAYDSVKSSFSDFDLAYSSHLEDQGILSGSVRNYDLSSYIDTEAISGLRQDLSENGADIESKIAEQNQTYEDFVSQVYENASENTLKQQESIMAGETASREKLETNLSEAKSGKRDTYEQNQQILTNIRGILPYTRLGTQENQLVYRFMTNPLVLDELAAQSDSVTAQNVEASADSQDRKQAVETNSITPVILLGIGALLILAAILGVLARHIGRTHRTDKL
nr:hypothetical protein [uncultured Mediterraneibacter sp.]